MSRAGERMPIEPPLTALFAVALVGGFVALRYL
jgi:hypothetical protein